MARVKELMGASAFFDALKALGDKSCIVYFTAAKKDDGVPWCPDCAEGMLLIFQLSNSFML